MVCTFIYLFIYTYFFPNGECLVVCECRCCFAMSILFTFNKLTAPHSFYRQLVKGIYKKIIPYIPDYKTRFLVKFKASKSKDRLIHRE